MSDNSSFEMKLGVEGFEQGSDQVIKFTKQMKESLNSLSNVKSFDQLISANQAFSKNIQENSSLIKSWRGNLNEAGDAIKYVKENLTSIEKNQLQQAFQSESVKNYGAALQTAGTKLQWAGRQISVGLTAPIIEFGREATHAFLAVNKQITDIQVNLMQMKESASGPMVDKGGFDIGKINSDLKEMTSHFAETKAEAAGMINDLTQMGFGLQKVNVEGIKSKDLAGGMGELASKMALIGHMSPDVAAKGIAGLTDAFVKGAPGVKTASDELSRSQTIMNQLSAEATKGKVSLAEMLEILPELSAVTDKTNTSVGAMAAIMGAAAQAGEKPQQMVNTLQQSFTRLFDTTNKKGMAEVANLRLRLFDDQGKAVGMLNIISQLSEKVNEMTDAQKTKLADIFGFRQTDNLTKFLRGFTQDTSDANKMLKQAGIEGTNSLAALAGGEANLGKETAKTLQELADQRLQAVKASPAFKFDQMKADLKNAMVTMGEVIATGIEPILRKLVDFFTRVADGFSKLPQAAKSLVVIGGLAVAAVGPIAMMAGVFMQFVGVFIKGVGDILNHYKGLKSVKDIDIANAGGKQQLIDAYKREGKAVFEAADGQLRYIEDTKRATKADFEAAAAAKAKIKAQSGSAGRISKADIPDIKQKFQRQPGETVKETRDRVKALEEEGKAAEQDASKIENLGVKTSILSNLSGKVSSAIKKIAPDFKGFGSEGAAATTEVGGGLSGLATKIPVIGGLLASVGSAIMSALAPIGAAIGGALAPVLAVAAAILAAIAIVVTHWKEFVSGIKAGIAPFKSAFSDISKIFKPVGDAWKELTHVFKSNDAKNAFDALGTAAKFMGEAIGIAFGVAAKIISTVFRPVLQFISSAFSSAFKLITSIIKTFIDLINGEWKKAAGDFAKVFISALGILAAPIQGFVQMVAGALGILVGAIEKVASAGSHLPIIGGAMKSVANALKDVKGTLDDVSQKDFIGAIQKGLDKDLNLNGNVNVSGKTKSSAASAGAEVGHTAGSAAKNAFQQEFGQFDPTGSAFAGKVKESLQKEMQGVTTEAKKQVSDAQAEVQRGLEMRQSAETRALDARSSAETKALDESTSKQQKALDRQIQQQQRALDEQITQEEKAYDRMQQEEQKAFDRQQQIQEKAYDRQQQAEEKAYDRQQQIEQDAFDRQQQAQKDALEASQKAQIAAIDNQIKAIDALSKAEEANLREEEYRTHRLELLQKQQENNENYLRDRAVAIYEGKVDDARKLDMEHTKNVQDSNKQIKDLDAQHARDLIQAQRDTEKQLLDDKKTALQQQFDAEKQALDQKLQMEKDTFTQQLQDAKDSYQQQLQDEKDAFQQQLQEEKDAYQQQLQDQKDAFQAMEQAKKDSFQQQAQDEKDALSESIQRQKDAQAAQIQAQKDALERTHQQQKDALDRQLADQRENLDAQLAAITEHVPKNVEEMQSQMDQIHNVLAAAGIQWQGDGSSAQAMFNNAVQSGAQNLRDDNFWASIGFEIVLGILTGGEQIAQQILNNTVGRLRDMGGGQMGVQAGSSKLYHSGGSIGSANESAEDVPATLQTGEYVIQRSAVRSLGTTLLDQINQGMMPRQKYHDGGSVNFGAFSGASLAHFGQYGAEQGGFNAMVLGQLYANTMKRLPGVIVPTLHTGGLVKATRGLGISASSIQKTFSEAKSNASMMLHDILNNNRSSIVSTTMPSTSNAVNSISSSDTYIDINVDTFIGQKEWFEAMMKDYNVKVKPKLNRAQGLESRMIKDYS